MQLVIAGEGEERPRLERTIAQGKNFAQVRLAGEVDDATLCELLASCDVFCLPSRERTEAFGVVLLEAMRYGKALAGERPCGQRRDLGGAETGRTACSSRRRMSMPGAPPWSRSPPTPPQRRLSRRPRLGSLPVANSTSRTIARRVRAIYALALASEE